MRGFVFGLAFGIASTAGGHWADADYIDPPGEAPTCIGFAPPVRPVDVWNLGVSGLCHRVITYEDVNRILAKLDAYHGVR